MLTLALFILQTIVVKIGREKHNLDLRNGRAIIPIENLSAGRSTSIRLEREGGPILLTRAEVVMGREFTTRADGPLELELHGDFGTINDIAAVEFTLRTHETQEKPILEIQLPAGMDDTEQLLEFIRASDGIRASEFRFPGYLRLSLTPMEAGTVRIVQLPIRWLVQGELDGFGAIAYPEDEPESMTFLTPHNISIR